MATSKTWIELAADVVEQYARERKGPEAKIVCASGISPSGAIHLGNLREAMTVHLVTEELRRRGWEAEHIHSCDDYDRLRKVPVGVPADFVENIGKPLADVPDPYGTLPSYSARFQSEFEEGLHALGIWPRVIYQASAYRRGDYNDGILRAIDARLAIFDILSEYQTLDRFEKDVSERRDEYYPIRVYCETCGKDDTIITGFERESGLIRYECHNCGAHAGFRLDEKVACKLVWKVDWPMRWSYEKVDFEPAGEDHAAPGSSYTVGEFIVREIYRDPAPYFIQYGFVGMEGRSKMSSSVGTSATPRAALEILEPPIIRWLYVRKNPSQKFNINFGQEVLRLYDEWDAFASRVLSALVLSGAASEADKKVYETCTQTSAGPVKQSRVPVSFRLLSSAADITQGNIDQIVRIAAEQAGFQGSLEEFRAALEPRLTCAINWATRYLPDDERTHIRAEFSEEAYNGLDAASREGIRLLLEPLEACWTLEGLTRLIYTIPKTLAGLPAEAEPTPAVKQAQRQFFKAIYSLVCASETGPRIPTLFLSLGQDKVKGLLSAR